MAFREMGKKFSAWWRLLSQSRLGRSGLADAPGTDENVSAVAVDQLMATELHTGYGDQLDIKNEDDLSVAVINSVGLRPMPGACAAAVLNMSAIPTTGDTVTIGADVYQFRASAAMVTNDDYIAVQLGVSPALCRTALIAAINAQDANNEHATIKLLDNTTPAKANGTENVVAAEDVAGYITITSALEPGGAKAGISPSIVLGEALTDAADVWLEGNVNLNTLGGELPARAHLGMMKRTVPTPVAGAPLTFAFPFTVTRFHAEARTSAGVLRAFTDAATIVGGKVVVTLGAGPAPNLQATDVVTVIAS